MYNITFPANILSKITMQPFCHNDDGKIKSLRLISFMVAQNLILLRKIKNIIIHKNPILFFETKFHSFLKTYNFLSAILISFSSRNYLIIVINDQSD